LATALFLLYSFVSAELSVRKYFILSNAKRLDQKFYCPKKNLACKN
jgi:hypothetical protein